MPSLVSRITLLVSHHVARRASLRPRGGTLGAACHKCGSTRAGHRKMAKRRGARLQPIARQLVDEGVTPTSVWVCTACISTFKKAGFEMETTGKVSSSSQPRVFKTRTGEGASVEIDTYPERRVRPPLIADLDFSLLLHLHAAVAGDFFKVCPRFEVESIAVFRAILPQCTGIQATLAFKRDKLLSSTRAWLPLSAPKER